MPGCPFTGGEDEEYPYTMTLNGTSLRYVCPCPNPNLEAAHGALSPSQRRRLVPREQRRKSWHVEMVDKLIKRKKAAAAERLH